MTMMATARRGTARLDTTTTTMAMGDDDNDVDGDGATGNEVDMGRNTITTAVADQIEEAAWRLAASLNCLALHRHRGGKERTAQAPRGEGYGGQRALC